MEIKLSQTAANQQNRFSEQILIMVQNYAKVSNKVLPLSLHQSDSNSFPGQCAKCKRSFKTSRRLNEHKRVCKEKQVIDPKAIETTSTTVFPIKNVTVDEENVWNANSDVMKNKFDEVYNKVVHWRKSLFLLPSGSTGKRFIEEMTRLVNSWTFRSEQDTIAMKVLMVLPTLLLKKNIPYIKIERQRRNF